MVKIPPSKFLLIQIKIEDWPTILRFSRVGGIEATLSFPRRIREIEVIEGTNGPTAEVDGSGQGSRVKGSSGGSCTRYQCPDRIERWSSLIDNGSLDGCLPHCAA